MSKEEHIYTSSQYKIKELRMWGDDDLYLGAYVFYKDGTHQFETTARWFTYEELNYISTSVKEYLENNL